MFIIWISDEIDTVVLNNKDKIITFESESDLQNYWQEFHLGTFNDITVYSIYKIQQWVANPFEKVDYSEFLNFWNLCTDISESVKINFSGDVKDEVRNMVYDKLFDGGGPFVAQDFDPIFDPVEIDVLVAILNDGLQLLLNNLENTE